ncbi:winged helix-turn-helix domain-containing protein [Saccharothrix sp. AJ9571]|nr:winged helix-turn-helix domain-containing protein [Saccharothrix sp. AJ9571]
MAVISVGLLGDVDVEADGRRVAVVPGKQRLLLSALCLSGTRTLATEELIDRLWEDAPPAAARTTLRGHVRRLRGTVTGEFIGGGRGGYRIGDLVSTDVARFRTARSTAGRSADPVRRRALLDEALCHWRGRPLSGVESARWVGDTVTALEEELLQAVEDWADLQLVCGDPGRALIRLTELVVRHPLRETLWVRLLRCLHASGRTAEAVDRFEHVRRKLAAELGVAPSAPLRELHQQLLRGDRDFDGIPIAAAGRL